MDITVDSSATVPPYEQVRSQLAQQINGGTLAVGAKLPTVRGLASELGIAANTAARAYRELEEAGMIDTRGRSGTYVSSSGDRSRRQAAEHAAEYARTVDGLGIGREEALAIMRAALEV